MEKIIRLFIVVVILFSVSCARDEEENCPPNGNGDSLTYNPTPVDLNTRLPIYVSRMNIPEDNPTTQEGIDYGRLLFYEPLLSGDGTQACGSCHLQKNNFTDPERFSTGIDNIKGNRNAMHIVNPGIGLNFFWDGRSSSLEDQAFQPVTNPIEMHETWPNAVKKLNEIIDYQVMNFKAFGSYTIDSTHVSKAIAQFERSLISNNSKFDRFKMDADMFPLTPMEFQGFLLFHRDRVTDINGNVTQTGADCFHCHIDLLDFSDNSFHNNGLDLYPADSGRALVSKNPADFGKFKTPSLRNVEYTAPYMHDGRFENLDSVINFYSEGVHFSEWVDDLMKNAKIGGVHLDSIEKIQLKAFLKTLSDPDFINNPDFSDPNINARRQLF